MILHQLDNIILIIAILMLNKSQINENTNLYLRYCVKWDLQLNFQFWLSQILSHHHFVQNFLKEGWKRNLNDLRQNGLVLDISYKWISPILSLMPLEKIVTLQYLTIFIIAYKIYETKYRNEAKSGRNRKIWYLLLRSFWPLLPKFYFQKGNWALSYTHVWDFSNIVWNPKILIHTLVGNSVGNLFTMFFVTDVKYRFTCCQSK